MAVITTLPGQRPQPPHGLSKAAAEEWRAIVGRMPPEWFTRETHPLLVSFCRHIVTQEVLARRIDKAEASAPGVPMDADYDQLLRMRDKVSRTMTTLATKLRITHQARYDAAKANTAAKQAGSTTSSAKPWDAAG